MPRDEEAVGGGIYYVEGLQVAESGSFFNFVLLHLDLEELRDVRFLAIGAVRIDHEAHRAVTAPLAGLGSVAVGGDGDKRVDSRVAIFGGAGLLLLDAVRGLGVSVGGPVGESRETSGLCLLVERDPDLQEYVRGEPRANYCGASVVRVQF